MSAINQRNPSLILSREALVKIGKQAWNVFPLEAFGFLLGDADRNEVLAALPCSKTGQWHQYNDRWNGLAEHFETATDTARQFRIEVVGVYGSTDALGVPELPPPELVGATASGCVFLYQTQCCPSCSGFTVYLAGQKLRRHDGVVLSGGKRARADVNQRRVHHFWLGQIGRVNYDNGYLKEIRPVVSNVKWQLNWAKACT